MKSLRDFINSSVCESSKTSNDGEDFIEFIKKCVDNAGDIKKIDPKKYDIEDKDIKESVNEGFFGNIKMKLQIFQVVLAIVEGGVSLCKSNFVGLILANVTCDKIIAGDESYLNVIRELLVEKFPKKFPSVEEIAKDDKVNQMIKDCAVACSKSCVKKIRQIDPSYRG